MLKEFREFVMRGNVVDMAVGIIVGAALGKIVTSFVSDILMPPIGLMLGKVDFNNLFINLSDKYYATLADAKAAGAVTINYGVFLNAVIDFLVVALVIFLVIWQINRLKRPAETPEGPLTTRECTFCLSVIPVKATRCAHCTSELKIA